jgi:integrase
MPRRNLNLRNPRYITVRKRADGSNYYHIRMVINGRRYNRFAHTIEAANLSVGQLSNKKSLGTLGDEINDRDKLKRTTMAELVRTYQNSVFFRQKRSSGDEHSGEEFKMGKVMCRAKWEDMLLIGFSQDDLVLYRDKRLAEGIDIETIKRELNPFRHMFRISKSKFHIPMSRNLFDELYEDFRKRPDREAYIEPHIIGKLLLVCKKDKSSRYRSAEEMTKLWQCLILTALFTGIRGSELFKIFWKDVDLRNRTIRLRAEITKNSKPRTIPLIVPLAIFLMSYHDRGPNGLPYFEGGREQRLNELVFPLRSGNAKVQEWVRMCKRAGILGARKGGYGFHDLRHTAVTNLGSVLAHYDLEYIKNGTTGNRYKHTILDDIERMKKQLDEAYWDCEPIIYNQETLDYYDVDMSLLLRQDKENPSIERAEHLLHLTSDDNPNFTRREKDAMIDARGIQTNMVIWLRKVGDLTEEQAIEILVQ